MSTSPNIRDIVAQVKSGVKSKTDAFNELKSILQSSSSKARENIPIDQQPTSTARFSQEDRRLLINKLVEKKQQRNSGQGARNENDIPDNMSDGPVEEENSFELSHSPSRDRGFRNADDTIVSSIVEQSMGENSGAWSGNRSDSASRSRYSRSQSPGGRASRDRNRDSTGSLLNRERSPNNDDSGLVGARMQR